ncbi:MAG: hypothetical protein ABSB59_43965 [Streptosporangiaceae bacterium]
MTSTGPSRAPTRYHSEKDFIAATFGRLEGVLRGGVKLEVRHLYVDGDTTVAELLSTSVTNEGAPFANRYCWPADHDDGLPRRRRPSSHTGRTGCGRRRSLIKTAGKRRVPNGKT